MWLGEAAQQLLWRAEYEAPSMHAAAAALRRQLQALHRRRDDSLKSATAAAERHHRHCSELGLAAAGTASLASELQAAVHSLPQKLRGAVEALNTSTMRTVVDMYAQLAPSRGAQGDSAVLWLPAVSAVLHGTTEPMTAPALEYLRTGAGRVQASTEDVAAGGAQDCPDAVPQSDVPASHGGEGGGSCCANEWGIISVQDGAADAGAGADGGCDAGGDAAVPAAQAQHSTAAGSAGAPEDECWAAASRLAFDDSFRAQFVADLYEIGAFCSRRNEEATDPEAEAVAGVLHSKAQDVTPEVCEKAAATVRAVLEGFQARPDVQMLFRVSASKVFAARLLRQVAFSKHQARFPADRDAVGTLYDLQCCGAAVYCEAWQLLGQRWGPARACMDSWTTCMSIYTRT